MTDNRTLLILTFPRDKVPHVKLLFHFCDLVLTSGQWPIPPGCWGSHTVGQVSSSEQSAEFLLIVAMQILQ